MDPMDPTRECVKLRKANEDLEEALRDRTTKLDTMVDRMTDLELQVALHPTVEQQATGVQCTPPPRVEMQETSAQCTPGLNAGALSQPQSTPDREVPMNLDDVQYSQSVLVEEPCEGISYADLMRRRSKAPQRSEPLGIFQDVVYTRRREDEHLERLHRVLQENENKIDPQLLVQAQEEISDLKERLTAAEEAAAVSESAAREAEAAQRLAEARADGLEEERETLGRQSDAATAASRAATAQLEQATAEKAALEGRVEELMGEIRDLQQKLEANDQGPALTTALEKVAELEVEIGHRGESMAFQDAELTELRDHWAGAQSRIAALEEGVTLRTQQATHLEEQLRLAGAEVGTLAQRLAEEEAQRGKAEEAKEDAERRSEAAGREVAALTQRLAEEGAARLKAENERVEAEQRAEAAEATAEEALTLNERLAEEGEQRAKAEAERAEAERQAQAMQAEVAALTQRLAAEQAKAEGERAAAERRAVAAEAEIQANAADLEAMAARLQDATAARMVAEARVGPLTLEVERLTGLETRLRADHAAELEAAREAAEGLTAAAQQQTQHLQRLQREYDSNLERIAELEAAKREAEAIRAERDALRREVGDLQARLADTSRAVSSNQSQTRPRPDVDREDTPPSKRFKRSPLPQPITPPQPSVPRVVAALSGFRNNTDPALVEYTNDSRKQTEAEIRGLGGAVAPSSGEDLDPTVTHVITAATSRTIKCLAAVLTGKWVVTVRWVRASHAANRWVDETPYGYRGASDVMQGKRVFLTDLYKSQCTRIKERTAHTTALVVTYGRGLLVDDLATADIVFVTVRENRAPFAPRPTFTWEQFIEHVYPVAAIAAAASSSSSSSSAAAVAQSSTAV